MTFCKHYQAMANFDVCKAGVAYKTVMTDKSDRPDRKIDFPCWNPRIQTCALQDWPTPEEIKAREDKISQMVQQFFTDLANDVCPHCHAPITSRRQVGRCVYAEPCGCRLYQGKLKEG